MTEVIDQTYKDLLAIFADSVIKKDTRKEIPVLQVLSGDVVEKIRAKTIAAIFFTTSNNSYFSSFCNRLIKDGLLEEEAVDLLLSRFNTALVDFKNQQSRHC